MQKRVVSPLIGLLAIAGMLTGMLFMPSSQAEAKPPQGTAVTAPVTGTFTNALGTGTFVGNLSVTRVINQSGDLAATGTLTGTLTDAVGNVIGTVNRTVTLPLAATGSCDILHLELGPLDLNVLGLVVHLDKIVLDIDAQSGPGNLLGNLLCAVAGLLDNGASTTAIVQLLNHILGLLSGV